MLVYLNKTKKPLVGTDRGWKEQMRRNLSRVIEEELLEAKVVIHGISWQFSHPLESGIDLEVEKGEEVQKIITRAMGVGKQNWDIKGAVVQDWEDVVIQKLDGVKRGERASQRPEDIAKANKWTQTIRSATWLGQHSGGDFCGGEPTGLRMSIVSKETPNQGVDRKYVIGGVVAEARKFEVFEWPREAGTNRE